MSPLHDDPRLTAYALGELNAADRAAVEQQIGKSVETLLEIESIREVAGQLRASLREEALVSAVTPLARSATAGVGPRTERPLPIETPSLARRASERPILAPVANDTSPSRKNSGKFAVAASCLALAGAFGIVAISGRHEQQNVADLAEVSKRIEWYDSDGAGVNDSSRASDPLLSMRATNAELLGELELKQRLYFGAGVALQESSNPNVNYFAESAGGSAGQPAVSGLGGFDVTALDNGPARPHTGLLRKPAGTNVASSTPNEGLERQNDGYWARRTLAGDRRQKPIGGKTTGLIAGKPADTHGEIEKLAQAKVVEVRKLGEIEERLKRRDHQFGFTTSLAGEVVATKESKPSGSTLIEVSLGGDDGLAEGERLSVIRAGVGNKAAKYLGEIRITYVTPDRAVGQVVSRAKGFVIDKGDQVVSIGNERAAAEALAAEAYAAIHDTPFASPLQEPLSTFSIDVDTAAYSNMRRFLTQGNWPPLDSVRIEELVNYFAYDYTPPADEEILNLNSEIKNQKSRIKNPFAVHMEVAACPWNAEHRLVRVGLKGKEIALDKRPVSNIVFLIDVSGSMQPANKLPLVKAGLRGLVEQFTENDRVGIVVYAGASGLVLDSTNATQKDVILSSIENLQAGGSTNGGEGIQLAYALARKHFINKGTNRVILCTDGDFNVGITNQDDLTRLIEEESKSGVFLSVLGFGMGNLKDSTLEKLADKGNGNYAYIDTLREANKVFVEQMTGTLITIAKDVKIQIEFNPLQVGAYRLIGYENRLLAAQDFRDDTKDAGEIGAGHTVTALYEIIPPSKLSKAETPVTKSLKYQPNVPSPAGTPATDAAALRKYGPTTASAYTPLVAGNAKNELLTIWLRYKQPDADKSDAEIEQVLVDEGLSFAKASIDFRWAASVASFGMILRNSPHKGNATLDSVLELTQSAIGPDKSGYREEFVSLVRSAKALQPHPTK